MIKYDGGNFFGWQLQIGRRTIQGVLEEALKSLLKSDVRIPIHGSGRTDSGVHSWGQVAHADLDLSFNIINLKKALNSKLPNDCEIISVIKIDKNFHSRFDAKYRFYRYQCNIQDLSSLLYRNQCWVLKSLDITKLNDVAKIIIGKHDFLSFSKFRKEIKNTICIISESKWHKENQFIIYDIKGNRFLHHMVRYLVGSMIAVSEGKISIPEFMNLLNNPRKEVRIFKAPPEGLILKKVLYE